MNAMKHCTTFLTYGQFAIFLFVTYCFFMLKEKI